MWPAPVELDRIALEHEEEEKASRSTDQGLYHDGRRESAQCIDRVDMVTELEGSAQGGAYCPGQGSEGDRGPLAASDLDPDSESGNQHEENGLWGAKISVLPANRGFLDVRTEV